MDIKYTKHALLRMEERHITKEDIQGLLRSRLLKAISVQDNDIILLMGYANQKGIVLILDETTNHLITVRRMRDKEKKLFEFQGGQSYEEKKP